MDNVSDVSAVVIGALGMVWFGTCFVGMWREYRRHVTRETDRVTHA